MSEPEVPVDSKEVKKTNLHLFLIALPLVWLPVAYMLLTFMIGTGTFLLFLGVVAFVVYVSLLPPALFLIFVFLVSFIKSRSHLIEMLIRSK